MMADDTSPLSVFLVKSGSKGDRLLFRYPYSIDDNKQASTRNKRKNPYALINEEALIAPRNANLGENSEHSLVGFPDKVLSNLFAVKLELCGWKFELKVNDVRFVGHPTTLSPNREPTTISMFNIVFALRANASHAIVECYHDLSQRLAIALHHEERRCGYLTKQAKMMVNAHDEVAAMPEDSKESPFHLILSKSQLAQDLRRAFEDLRSTGTVHLKVHKWIEVSFCLPSKVHLIHNKDLVIEPKAIQASLRALRPYHGILLLVEPNELLDSLPQDASPALIRLVRIVSPVKCLQQLAADADLTLSQVFQLVAHLVYWAKATIIYPLCDKNVYVLSPNAPTQINSSLAEKFAEKFKGMSLLAALSQFSLPTSLSQLGSPMNLPQQQAQQVQMVVWMLQHRLLMQLHTYVYLMPTSQPSSIFTADNRSPTDDRISISQGASYSDFGSSYPSEESLTISPSHSGLSDTHSKSGSEEDLSHREQDDTLLVLLTPAERETILKEAASRNKDDIKLFDRLCPHFRGFHHLEEIMYYENVRRSQLLALLDKFRHVLITCQHEDAAVAAFYKRN